MIYFRKESKSKANEVKVRSNSNINDDLGEIIQSINDKPFSCNLCVKKFTLKSTLTVHMRQHTRDPLLSCKFCLKVYKSYQALKYHLLKKHDYKWQPINKKIKKATEVDSEHDIDKQGNAFRDARFLLVYETGLKIYIYKLHFNNLTKIFLEI